MKINDHKQAPKIIFITFAPIFSVGIKRQGGRAKNHTTHERQGDDAKTT